MTRRRDCRPEPGPKEPLSAAELERATELARLAKGLGHPARAAIVKLLLRRKSCVCGEIVDEIPLAQSTVSQHLKQLKTAGLIQGEIDGPRVCYCIAPKAIERLRALVAAL